MSRHVPSTIFHCACLIFDYSPTAQLSYEPMWLHLSDGYTIDLHTTKVDAILLSETLAHLPRATAHALCSVTRVQLTAKIQLSPCVT